MNPLQALRRVWSGPARLPTLQIVGLAVGVPVLISAVSGVFPPLGVYLYGAVIGSLYALIAIGLILVYRSTRILNFAQAGMGASPATAAILLYADRHWPYAVTPLIVIAGSLLLGGIIEVLVIRRFSRAPRLILMVATIGVAQILAFVEISIPGWVGGQQNLLHFVNLASPLSRFHADIGGFVFTADSLLAICIVALVAVGLAIFFGRTRYGIAARATAENTERASMLGVPIRRVSTLVWMLAALLSGVGVFLEVSVNRSLPAGSLTGPETFLFAFAPAVIAGMESLPVAFGAGIAIGMIDQAAFYVTRNSGLSEVLMLPIILVAFLINRRRMSRAEGSGVATWADVKPLRPIPRELRSVREVVVLRWGTRLLIGGLLVGAPFIVGPLRRDLASLFLLYGVIGISLVILTGWGGQISLGQFALAGVGGAVAAGLVSKAGADFFLALFVAGVVGAGLAVVLGIPAVRLTGLFLAVTTLSFAIVTADYVLNREHFSWLLPPADRVLGRPVLWQRLSIQSDTAFYYFCLVVLALTAYGAFSLRAHRSGRVMIAARDNPLATQSYGINLARSKLATFALAGFLAAIAGALIAFLEGGVDPLVFSADNSLLMFSMAVIGGLTSVPGALAGAAYVVVFQYLLPSFQVLATGVGMLILLLYFPGGLSELGQTARDKILRKIALLRGIHVPSLDRDSLEPGLPSRTDGDLPVRVAQESPLEPTHVAVVGGERHE